MQRIHWAIVGTGDIASEFSRALHELPTAAVPYAVVSRALDKARAFAEDHGFARAYDDLPTMLADPRVQAVYVATPHPDHFRTALAALRAGKAVLCEKPVTLNLRQFEVLAEAAEASGVFLLEAMKTPYQPALRRVDALLASGAIGPIRHLEASFCFHCGDATEGRWLNLTLGGGALLDVGVYPLHLAYHLLGEPTELTGHACLGRTGVDEHHALLAHYPGGATASLYAAVRGGHEQDIRIAGEYGQIELLDLIRWDPQGLRWRRYGEDWTVEHLPTGGSPLRFEAAEVHRCLAAGLKESPVVPHAQTRAILRQLDTLRAQWGLVYPGDAE